MANSVITQILDMKCAGEILNNCTINILFAHRNVRFINLEEYHQYVIIFATKLAMLKLFMLFQYIVIASITIVSYTHNNA